ncbi:hypothetical protein F5Y17DRAFT_447898 [Xylariaceae sp. FL0594]|nr:hypothetical protein F5Y17DRAFT_447898 [Xylariaceae sp. FL0594]
MADTDSDVDEFGSSPIPPETSEPDTDSEREYPQLHSPTDALSPLNLSPPISLLDSPSLSPYSPLSPPSPLRPGRRLFSPPIDRTSSPSPQSDEARPDGQKAAADITQNSARNALVERLNDLAHRLSRQDVEEDEGNVDVLHAKVDELETLLSIPARSSTTTSTKAKSRAPSDLIPVDERSRSMFWSAPRPDSALPSDVSSLFSTTRKPSRDTKSGECSQGQDQGQGQGQGGTRATTGTRAAARMTVAQAEQVIEEAQTLHNKLEAVIANLRDRQEETEHIHGLLITRLERAAQRIIDLEEQVSQLERERRDEESEMLNLQIQLKAIEVQCLSYVPADADRELRESIDAWKMEYSALKQKRARKKKKTSGLNSSSLMSVSSNIGTPRLHAIHALHGSSPTTMTTPRTPSTPVRIRRPTPSSRE